MTVVSANTKNPLAERLSKTGGRLSEYSGATTAANFGDVEREFDAITHACGVYDLGWRGKIAVTGEDRVRWLNGMVTNNLKDLAPNHGNYNFVLNAQGRIQGDLYVYNRGEQLLIETDHAQVESLLKTLGHFIIMDDVELTDESDKTTSIGVQGPKASKILEVAGISASCAGPLVVCDIEWKGAQVSVTRMVSDDFLTYEMWMSPEIAPLLWDSLVAAGAVPAGTDALEKFRIFAGVPKFGTDILNKHLPQETAQKHALNFNKGCYIGQEIVERIRSQANVHRTFTGFLLDESVEVGAKVVSEEKEVGVLTSVTDITIGGKQNFLALGYIRKDAINKVPLLTSSGVSVHAATLPFKVK